MNLPPDFQLFQEVPQAFVPPPAAASIPGLGAQPISTQAPSQAEDDEGKSRDERSASLPVPSLPKPPRRRTAEMTKLYGPTLTGSAERGDSEAWGMEGVAAPVEGGDQKDFRTPHTDHPLSGTEQNELMEVFAERGGQLSPNLPSNPANPTAGGAPPLPSSNSYPFAPLPGTGLPSNVDPSLAAAQEAARKTVSPQEAFLDYDANSQNGGRRGIVGGSLFAPLPKSEGEVQRKVREGSSGAVPGVGGSGARGGAAFDKPGNAVPWDNNEDGDAEGEEVDEEDQPLPNVAAQQPAQDGFVKPYVPPGFKEKKAREVAAQRQAQQAAEQSLVEAANAAALAEEEEAMGNTRRAITPAPPSLDQSGNETKRHASLPPELSRTREPTPPLPPLPAGSDLDAEGDDDEYLAPPPPPHARRESAGQRVRKRTSVYVDQLSSDSQNGSSSDELEDDDPTVVFDDDADGDDDDDFYDSRPYGSGGKKAGRTIGGVSRPDGMGGAGPSGVKRRKPNNPNGPSAPGTIRCNLIAADGTGQVCGTVFRRPYDLARHKETIHGEGGGGKPKKEHVCDKCGGVFSRKDALIRHKRIRGHQ